MVDHLRLHVDSVSEKKNKINVYEINFFIAGWCAFACFDNLIKQNYGMALLNGVLAFVNIKVAKQ